MSFVALHRRGRPSLCAASKERLLLVAHRGRLHRQRLLDPLVVRDELAVGERELVPPVVGAAVGAAVAAEDSGISAGRVSE